MAMAWAGERKGFVTIACDCAEGRAIAEQWAVKAEEGRTRTLTWACIPPRFAAASLTDFTADDIPPEAFLALEGQSIMLVGPAGIGKTHLAVALLRILIAEGSKGLFVDAATLLDHLRALYHPNAPYRPEELWEAIEGTDVVLLDDLNPAYMTAWAREKLYQLINSRYLWLRQTLVTTLLSPRALSQRLSDRVVSRLCGLCVVVTMKGADRRVQTWRK